MIPAKAFRRQIIHVLFFVLASRTFVFANDTKLPSVMLLDVSGSMEREATVRYSRYSSGQINGIAQQLGRSIASADGTSPIYVQPFASSHDTFALRGPVSVVQIHNALPTTANAQETELDAGLLLGMKDRPNSYLFMLTDNKNDFAGSKSDRRFYDLLAKSPAIHTVYFVPLARSGVKESLVLYALACGSAHRSVLRQIITEFAKAAQTDYVQFRGFYDDKEQESLSFGQHVIRADDTGEELPATMEGDAIVVPYDEGRLVDGALKFRIHSNLKNWRIHDGELRKLEVRLDVPTEYAASGQYKLPLMVAGGRKMDIAPGGDSAEVYTLPLSNISDEGVSLVRASLFKTSLPDITARIHLSAVIHVSNTPGDSGIRPEISEALKHKIEAVQNLPEIMNLMTFQPGTASTASDMERVIPVNREIHIRVTPSPIKNLLVRLIQFGIPLLLLSSIAALAFLGHGKIYTVTEPGERTRKLKFPFPSHDAALIWNGQKVATIHRYGSGKNFLIRPEPGFRAEPTNVTGNPTRFQICNTKSGDRGLYQLREESAPLKAAARRRHL